MSTEISQNAGHASKLVQKAADSLCDRIHIGDIFTGGHMEKDAVCTVFKTFVIYVVAERCTAAL